LQTPGVGSQFYNRNHTSAAHAGLKRALTPKTCPIKLNLAATNIRTGKIKVFAKSEISVEAVLASACLPFLFQAVEIGGEAYWHGGYTGAIHRSSRSSITASSNSNRCRPATVPMENPAPPQVAIAGAHPYNTQSAFPQVNPAPYISP
jgi:hypothetical protein